MKHEVIIVGAGPGGVTCAWALAQRGIRVLLLEKSRFPRDKICGDALSGKVVSVLRQLDPQALDTLQEFSPKLDSWGIRFIAPNRKVLDVPFKLNIDPTQEAAPGYISKRLDFDHYLLKQLEAFPEITIVEDAGVESIEVGPEGVIVKDQHHTYRSQLVVGADGAQSVVAKQLANFRMEPQHFSAGIRAYYQGVTGFHSHNFVELHFLKDLLPGYFWVFPLPNGWANVGLGMLSKDISRHKVNLKKKLLEIVANDPDVSPRFKHAQPVDAIRGFGLPLGSRKRPISGERFLLVGDAASLIDPFSGEGIGNAMLSGKAAAAYIQASLKAQDYSATYLKAYDREVYKGLWSELRLSRTMQRLVKAPWLFNMIVQKANKNESLRTMLTMMFEDLEIRKELSNPRFYLNLLRG